jgi:hypothetical protein
MSRGMFPSGFLSEPARGYKTAVEASKGGETIAKWRAWQAKVGVASLVGKRCETSRTVVASS